jgi:hypothetical protein
MKTIIKTMLLCAAATCFFSCEDFLTKIPETSLSPENFFSSEKELMLWVNKDMDNILPGADDMASIKGDDYIGKTLDAIQKGTRTTATNGLWTQGNWRKLRHINQFFENCHKCKDDAIRAKYMGIEYFLRAWFYYEMLCYYGDVPFYDYVLSSDNQSSLMKARDSRGFIAWKIISDLDNAAAALP